MNAYVGEHFIDEETLLDISCFRGDIRTNKNKTLYCVISFRSSGNTTSDSGVCAARSNSGDTYH